MDDLQRQPEDDDRDAVIARIKRAHEEARIGAADRDIRLANVRSAQSMAELDLMTRELDQLDAVLPPPTTAVPVTSTAAPYDTFEPSRGGGDIGQVVSVSGRALAIAFALILAAGLVVAGVVFVGSRDSQSGQAAPGGNAGDTPGDTPGETSAEPAPPEEEDPEGSDPPPQTRYALTAPGIRGFLQTYQRRFNTTKVVDLTMYDGYVIVNVPVPGKARQSGWLFRDNEWTPFGGVRAVFPGARIVETRQLSLPALMRNIKRARTTLNVEKPTQTYVIVRSISQADEVPSVDIHVSNEFRESGYLATTLDGKVERAFPYTA